MNAVAVKTVEVDNTSSDRRSHSRLDFHMGEAFCRVASEYPTLVDIVLEQIQNAIDANAKNILVVLNRKTRHIAIRDNGDGVTQIMFEEALRRVCLSSKQSGKLGRFGIGLISPLGKCEQFTFTSCHKSLDYGFREWTFATNDIRGQAQEVTIPHRARNDLFYIKGRNQRAPRNLTTVMWRTEVNIFKYSQDKMISRIGSLTALKDAILERFSAAMRKNKVKLSLKFKNENGQEECLDNIEAEQFTGRKLPMVVLNDPDAGKVTFSLYLAPKTTKGQNGKVLVGEADNDYRFPFELFARTCNLLSDDVVSGLKSGIFEGEILAEKVTLHATRKAFERDDAFVGFCAAIETWFGKHGTGYLTEVKEARREERYQNLGLESLRLIEAMLQNPAFDEIRSVLDSFKLGTVGPAAAVQTPKAEKQGELSILTSNEGPRETEDTKMPGSSKSPPKPDEEPYTVAGPRGQRRALVKRGNLGLQFSYITMDGSDKLWELDIRQGVLHFNVNHPTWVACDVSDRKVRQLQETVAVHALMTKAMPADYEEVLRYGFDEALRAIISLYHESPAFTFGKKAPPS